MSDHEEKFKAITYASRKHRKELKRKHKKYNASNWSNYLSSTRRSNARSLDAPLIFSIVKNPEAVIAYFDGVRFAQESREFIEINLSEIEYTDLATVSLLMSHMYDTRLPMGYLAVSGPSKDQPNDIFKKVEFDTTVTSGNSNSAHFLSRQGVSDNYENKISIINRANEFNKGKKDTSLNPILTEIFSNTNNHASVKSRGVVPWLVTLEENEEDRTIKFCVTDLGIGIYDRLMFTSDSVKKFTLPAWMSSFFQDSQNKTLSKNIPKGLISSTNLFYRGQGMKNLYTIATNGSFKNFNIITNKAHINLLNLDENKEDALHNFRGTLYYWTIQYE